MGLDELLPGLDAAKHLHPLFVHFPLALWLTATAFWGVGAWRKRDDLFSMGSWLLYLGVAAGVVALATGLLASDQIGHDAAGHDLVHVHRNWMLAASGLALATAIAAFATRAKRSASRRWSLFAAMLVTNVVVMLGADRGALLVFGHGIGVSDTASHESGGSDAAHDDGHEGHSH